jgi:hypothetical protein
MSNESDFKQMLLLENVPYTLRIVLDHQEMDLELSKILP